MSVEIQKNNFNDNDLQLMNEHAKLVYYSLYGTREQAGVHISFLQMIDSFLFYLYSTIIFIILFLSVIGWPFIASLSDKIIDLHTKIYKRLQKKGTYSYRTEKAMKFSEKLGKQFPANYWTETKTVKIPFNLSLVQAQDLSVAKRLDKDYIPFAYEDVGITPEQLSSAQKALGIACNSHVNLSHIRFSNSTAQPGKYNLIIKLNDIVPEYWKTQYGTILLNTIKEKQANKKHSNDFGPKVGDLTYLTIGSELTNYFESTINYSIIPA